MTLTLDDTKVEYALPTGTARLPLGDSLAGFTEPEGSGGLLAALALWRRLLAAGPEKFGNLHYEGSFPLPGLPGQYDVFLGTRRRGMPLLLRSAVGRLGQLGSARRSGA
ncbi:MAG: hypothetical protein QM775_17520 [Pirellulales bacterium]